MLYVIGTDWHCCSSKVSYSPRLGVALQVNTENLLDRMIIRLVQALDVGAERLGLPTNNYILQKGGRLTVNKILITLAATLAATVTDTSWTYPETEAMKHTSAIVRLLYTGEKREVLKLATSKATSAKNGKRNDVEGVGPRSEICRPRRAVFSLAPRIPTLHGFTSRRAT
jgi:hypothetical protein